ncbi:MAG: M23 family metallopeptidase [Patescibacteria group bacterium]
MNEKIMITSVKIVYLLSVVAGALFLSGCTRQAGIAVLPENGAVINQSVNANANTNVPVVKDFIAPISDALSHIAKKPFGIFITPKNSPVQPERFTGYHTGVDFETMPSEANTEVGISAACAGVIRVRQWVSGYGGVLVQDCVINGQTVTVLYGHMNIDSVTTAAGQTLKQGDFIGNLGQGNTQQTDGERKHLHIAIHVGELINYKGYVSSQDQLKSWLDPQKYL